MADGAPIRGSVAWSRASSPLGLGDARTQALPEVLLSPEGERFTAAVLELEARAARITEILASASPRESEVLETFKCIPLEGAWVTRSTCGQRFTETTNPADQRGIRLTSGTCAGCAMGAKHAAGETPASWPDGALVELRVLARSTAPASLPRAPASLPPHGFSMQRSRVERERHQLPIAGDREARRLGLEANAASGDTGGAPAAPRASADLTPRDSRERPAPITAAPAAEEQTRMGPKPKTISWKGEEKTAAEWAAELGVSTSAVRFRVAHGKHPDGSPIDGAAAKRAEKAASKPAKRSAKAKAAAPDAEPEHTEASDVESLLRVTGIEHQVLARTAAGVTFFVPASA